MVHRSGDTLPSFGDNGLRSVPRRSTNWYRYCNDIIDVFSYWDCSLAYMWRARQAGRSRFYECIHSYERPRVRYVTNTTQNLARKAKDPVSSTWGQISRRPPPLEYGTGSYAFLRRRSLTRLELFVYLPFDFSFETSFDPEKMWTVCGIIILHRFQESCVKHFGPFRTIKLKL